MILPTISYGKTSKGTQLTKADDACDGPASLNQAIQDQLLAPYEFVVPSPSADVAGAPTLRIDIADILAAKPWTQRSSGNCEPGAVCGPCAPRPSKPALAKVLGVHVVVQSVARAFAAVAGFLDTAERRRLGGDRAFVDADDA